MYLQFEFGRRLLAQLKHVQCLQQSEVQKDTSFTEAAKRTSVLVSRSARFSSTPVSRSESFKGARVSPPFKPGFEPAGPASTTPSAPSAANGPEASPALHDTALVSPSVVAQIQVLQVIPMPVHWKFHHLQPCVLRKILSQNNTPEMFQLYAGKVEGRIASVNPTINIRVGRAYRRPCCAAAHALQACFLSARYTMISYFSLVVQSQLYCPNGTVCPLSSGTNIF